MMAAQKLKLFEQTVQVFGGDAPFVEARVLGNGPARSGLFTDAIAAAAAVATVDEKRNTYIIANPIKRDYQRGSFGKFANALKGSCVADCGSTAVRLQAKPSSPGS